jgi:cyclin-dependent kinase
LGTSIYANKRKFEAFYKPLRDLIQSKHFDGLDLDIEEPTSIFLTTKLLKRLRSDFGENFLLTLAPVMPALLPLKPYLAAFCYRLLHPELPPPTPLVRAFIKAHLLPSHSHMSGFNHFELESSEAGKLVSWYNVQFYCGWGDAGDERLYEAIVSSGWNPRKVVLGVVTNPENGSGFVDMDRLGRCVTKLREKYGDNFGGIMGWEYFNAGGAGKPEEWVRHLAGLLGKPVSSPTGGQSTASAALTQPSLSAEAPISAPTDTAEIQGAMQDATLLGGTLANTPAATAPATAIPVPPQPSSEFRQDAQVQRLVEMGFDRADAVAALEAMGGDVDAAAGLLFGD